MADNELLKGMVLTDFRTEMIFKGSIERKYSLDGISKVARQYTIDELANIRNNCQDEIERLSQQIELIKENMTVLDQVIAEKTTMETHNVAFVEKIHMLCKNDKTGRDNIKRMLKISVVETGEDEMTPLKVAYEEVCETINTEPMLEAINRVAEQYAFSKVVFMNLEAPTEMPGFEVVEKEDAEYCTMYDVESGEGLEEIDEAFMVRNAFVVPK